MSEQRRTPRPEYVMEAKNLASLRCSQATDESIIKSFDEPFTLMVNLDLAGLPWGAE